MEMATPVRKRTIWIWIISISCLISSLMGLRMQYLLASGNPPMELLRLPYFTKMTFFDNALLTLLYLLGLCGAITLFLLRKAAFYLFATSLLLSLLIKP